MNVQIRNCRGQVGITRRAVGAGVHRMQRSMGGVKSVLQNAWPMSFILPSGLSAFATSATENSMEPQGQSQKPEPGFMELGIDRLFMAGLAKMKVTRPSAIQAAVIPEILKSDNVAMQSYTGSGKTLAFLLPSMTLAISRAEAMFKSGQADVPLQLLVVAPSQELAMQIVRVAQGLLPDEHRRMVQQCIGGANPKYQMDALLMNKPLIVVGTPGRVAEFIRLGALKLHRCPLMVLDEADQLLSPNFTEDMSHINAHCGKSAGERQTVLVSATLSQTVLGKMSKWCPNMPRFVTAAGAPPAPRVVAATAADGSLRPPTAADGPSWGWGVKGWDGPASEAAPKTQGAAGGVEGSQGLVPTMPPNLRHLYLVVDPRHKADALRRCIHALDAQRVLVFMNYQQRLRDTMYKLEARRMKVATLHGEMEKMSRANILNDFRRGRLRALVVSDVVARGLDVSECDAVFHAELPSSAAHYAHRAGRTGRMDAPGTVVSIVAPQEVFVMEKLSKNLGVPILEGHVSRGQVILGPAPASLRYDDDEEEDEKTRPSKKVAAKSMEQEAASLEPSKIKPSAEAISDSSVARKLTGSQANVSGRVSGSKADPSASTKGKGSVRHDSDDDDDDGDVAPDIAQLEKQLQKAKAASGNRTLPPSSNTKLSSLVKSELQRELEALHGARSDAKLARRSAKDQPNEAGSESRRARK